MMLDELLDLDKERLTAVNMLIRQKEREAKTYNKKVTPKVFMVNDLVWKFNLPMDRTYTILGKWSHNWKGSFRFIQAFLNNVYETEETNLQRETLKINGKYLKECIPMLKGRGKHQGFQLNFLFLKVLDLLGHLRNLCLIYNNLSSIGQQLILVIFNFIL